MTFAEFVAALRRRWVVLAVLLAVTAGAAMLVPRDVGVYWGRVTLVFLPPVSSRGGNILEGSDPSLIYFAAVVDRSSNGGRSGVRLASDSATMYGTGVRQGSSVSLVDSGGQWRTNFNRPMLSIEVVDPTRQGADDRIIQLIAEVQQRAESLQREAGSPTGAMIRTELSQPPSINYIDGRRSRAVLAVGALGVALSLAGTFAADAYLTRRENRRRQPA